MSYLESQLGTDLKKTLKKFYVFIEMCSAMVFFGKITKLAESLEITKRNILKISKNSYDHLKFIHLIIVGT